MSRTIISARTGAVATKTPVQYNEVPVSLFATLLGTGEEITIWFSEDDGTTWEELYLDGSQVLLTETNKAVTLYGPLVLAVTKPSTTAAVGVFTSHLSAP